MSPRNRLITLLVLGMGVPASLGLGWWFSGVRQTAGIAVYPRWLEAAMVLPTLGMALGLVLLTLLDEEDGE